MNVLRLEEALAKELHAESSIAKRAIRRAALLTSLVWPSNSANEYPRYSEVRKFVRAVGYNDVKTPSSVELGALYRRVRQRQDAKRGFDVLRTTPAQASYFRQLQHRTKMHFRRNFWIGPYNVDLFSEAVGGDPLRGLPRFRGMIIEIDGPVHDLELKMRKDHRRLEFFQRLGLVLYSVQNRDLYTAPVKALIEGIAAGGPIRRLDHRARQRVMRRIHLETIWAYAKRAELNALFGFSVDEVASLMWQGRNA